MKYQIQSLRISNYLRINKISLEIPKNTQWVFLTGENGCGKSMLLNAISQGLTLKHNPHIEINENKIDVEMPHYFKLDGCGLQFTDGQEYLTPVIFKYNIKTVNRIVTYLKKNYDYYLIPLIHDILCGLVLTSNSNIVFTNTKECEGIVLIDEIENHLHPKMQKQLVVVLSELFPKVQFIVSTNSVIPMLGASKEMIVISMEKNTNNDICATVLTIDITNLLPNAILTSPIFQNFNISHYLKDRSLTLKPKDYSDDAVFELELKRKLEKL